MSEQRLDELKNNIQGLAWLLDIEIGASKSLADRLSALEAKAAKPHERLEALEKAIGEIRAQLGILMFGKRHDAEGEADKEEAGKRG